MSEWQSEEIGELSAAMVKVQAALTPVAKEADNPFFKSKYADLDSCITASRVPLTDNGVSVIQTTRMVDEKVCLITTLAHTSGQWMAGATPLIADGNNPMQALGSAITYARRYALCAAVGLSQEDDDGNSTNLPKSNKKPAATEPKKEYGDTRDALKETLADLGVPATQTNAALAKITGDKTMNITKVFKGVDDCHALDVLGRIQQAIVDGIPKEEIWR